jgi:galactoside O-acetyltransferase
VKKSSRRFFGGELVDIVFSLVMVGRDEYPITVGNNVWIGAQVVVLPGVTIGDEVVIGAGSVVNKDIPSGVIAAGNPCKVIRKITENDKGKYLKE